MCLRKQKSNNNTDTSELYVALYSVVSIALGLAVLLNRKLRWTHDSEVMTQRTKSDLARRLGIAEADLITRKEAAQLLGLDEDTLRSGAKAHIGFFRRSDAKAARALYPKPWVEDYKRWRAEGRQQSYRHGKRLGPQPWPEEPEPRAIGLPEAMLMIERWKYRELHRRCEAICIPGADAKALWDTHRQEARQLHGQDGSLRSADEPDFAEVLARKAQEIAVPCGVIVEPAPLARLILVVWEQVLKKERDWLSAIV